MPTNLSYPLLSQPLVDPRGYLARPWQQFFEALAIRVGADRAMTNLELEDETSANAATAASNAAAIQAERVVQAFVGPPRRERVEPPFVAPGLPRIAPAVPFASAHALAAHLWALVASVQASLVPTVSTWTPVLEGASTAGSHTYSQQVGYYWRLGRVVLATWRLTLTAKDAAMAGNVLVTGLPVAAVNVGTVQWAASLTFVRAVNLSTGYTQVTGLVPPNTTQVQLFENGDNVNEQNIDAAAIASTTALGGTVTYLVAA